MEYKNDFSFDQSMNMDTSDLKTTMLVRFKPRIKRTRRSKVLWMELLLMLQQHERTRAHRQTTLVYGSRLIIHTFGGMEEAVLKSEISIVDPCFFEGTANERSSDFTHFHLSIHISIYIYIGPSLENDGTKALK
jgi:hypothetical protein